MKSLYLFIFCILSVTSQASNASVLDSGWHTFNFGGVGSTTTIFNENLSNNAELTVVDCCLFGDQFAVFDNGSLLGLTSTPVSPSLGGGNGYSGPTALADPRYSYGYFFLTSGQNDIVIEAVQSPWGSGGAFFEVASTTAPVPEPETITLFALGLLGLGLARNKALTA